ncbi:MAG: hypothetical protein SGARI_006698, partial [Bacillariaceae sp.]
YWDLRQAILFAISRATEANNIKFAYKDKNKMTPTNTMPGLAHSQDSIDYVDDMGPFQERSDEKEGDVNDMNIGGHVPFDNSMNGDLSNPKKQMP